MSSTARNDGPRYATLRDYLRVLRRNRLLIVLITIACAALAYVYTAGEQTAYTATASVYFEDPTQNIDLLGTSGVFPALPDATRAQIAANSITREPIASRVKSDLHSRLSIGALAAPVSAYVDTQTNVVVIQSTSSNPRFAQTLANAFANAAREVNRDQARAQFIRLANQAKAQFAGLAAVAKDPYTRSVYANRITTLEFLGRTADPVQLIQSASLPSSPAGPNKTRNTIIGLLLGLIIALATAFARDALDRRLRGTAEIGEQLGWPILGHVRTSAFGARLFVARNGKLEADEGDREAFRMLRENLRFLDVENPPNSVVVTSALPEEGKSTVAATLACAFAAAGTRTLLVECDLRRPSIAERFGLAKSPGLADYLLGDAAPSDTVQVIELAAPATLNGASANGNGNGNGHGHITAGKARRLACITAGRHALETSELLASARFKSFLAQVTEAYDQVVIDASPLLSVADTTPIIPEADATLVCVRADRTTQDQAAALKQAVDRIPHRLVGVVVTGVRPGSETDAGYYASAYTAKA